MTHNRLSTARLRSRCSATGLAGGAQRAGQGWRRFVRNRRAERLQSESGRDYSFNSGRARHQSGAGAWGADGGGGPQGACLHTLDPRPAVCMPPHRHLLDVFVAVLHWHFVAILGTLKQSHRHMPCCIRTHPAWARTTKSRLRITP